MRRQRKIIEDEELEQIESSKQKQVQSQEEENSKTKANLKNCPVCYECMAQVVFLECLHKFCLSCIKTIVSHNQRLLCPLCRKEFQEYNIFNILKNDKLEWIQQISIDVPQIESSQVNSNFEPSYDFESAPSIQECQQCFCNDDPDEMIRCHNCQRIIGHVYCFPNLIHQTSLCQQCIDFQI